MSRVGKDGAFEHVARVLDAAGAFTNAVREHDNDWYFAKMRAYAEGLFERAPFKPGDRVRLTATPEISSEVRWGWLGAKHFMVKGALATVREVDFSRGQFEAYLHMDDETWIDSEGVHRPVDSPSLYHFWENQIERVVE